MRYNVVNIRNSLKIFKKQTTRPARRSVSGDEAVEALSAERVVVCIAAGERRQFDLSPREGYACVGN